MAERIEYELTEAEDELLLAATKDYVGFAGELGGAMGAPLGFSATGAKAGGAGGRFSVRFMTRPRSAAASAELPLAPAEAHERARAGIDRCGFPIEDPNQAGDGSLWGVLPSGAGGMMPALVRVDVRPSGTGSRIEVRATGREGLIKQGIASKAVDRLLETISAPAA